VTTGRFAPTPSGMLHVGNLRTAVLAWLMARTADGGRGGFVVRIDDLDPAARNAELARRQLDDLAVLGIDHDGDIVQQSTRSDRYDEVIDTLTSRGLTYPCWCSRAEVLAASVAPHGDGRPEGAYPGTCAQLDGRGRRARAESTGRRPALRLRAHDVDVTITDEFHGPLTVVVDDFVVRRADGVAAYNLAVVVDDADSGVDQVVRGDDLLASTPRQALLARLLDLNVSHYAHVPLVTDPHGDRLAKRGGATTLGELDDLGVPPAAVLGHLATSIGIDVPDTEDSLIVADLLPLFDFAAVPKHPWAVDPAQWVP